MIVNVKVNLYSTLSHSASNLLGALSTYKVLCYRKTVNIGTQIHNNRDDLMSKEK